MNIKQLIEKGESKILEFKESLSLKSEIGESVSAFSNTNNGTILVGVSDEREIRGVEIGKRTIENLANFIKQNTDNFVYPDISIEKVDEKHIIIIKVNKSDEKPVFFRDKTYKRVGKSNHKLSASEIRKLAKESGEKVYWDGQVCDGAGLGDIDEEAVNKFRELYEYINKTKIKSSNKELLKSLKCAKEINREVQITNSGILLFGKKSNDFLPMSYITIARYPEKEREQTYSDIKNFHGNLFEIVDSANEYIKQYVQEVSRVVEGQLAREVIPQYSYYAIRELITNAVVHKDYSLWGSRVIIRIFKDRIEFNSPGSLPTDVTPKNIVDAQFSRNSTIAEVFNKVQYIEKLGEGWDKIISAVKEHPFKPKFPEIRDIGGAVVVTLFSPKEELLEGVVEPILSQLNERQEQVLFYLIKNKKITRVEYEKFYTVSGRTANRELNEMINGKLIEKKGTGPATYYILARYGEIWRDIKNKKELLK